MIPLRYLGGLIIWLGTHFTPIYHRGTLEFSVSFETLFSEIVSVLKVTTRKLGIPNQISQRKQFRYNFPTEYWRFLCKRRSKHQQQNTNGLPTIIYQQNISLVNGANYQRITNGKLRIRIPTHLLRISDRIFVGNLVINSSLFLLAIPLVIYQLATEFPLVTWW